MIETLRTLWHERSPRERIMLSVMFALLALTILWFGVIAPTISGLEAAKARHNRAVVAVASVQGKAALLKRLNETPPPPLGAPVAGFVKLIVSAKPAAFFKWIGSLDQKGVFVDQITVRTNSDATIGVDATLKARAL
jgi:general secretion pathway protein M